MYSLKHLTALYTNYTQLQQITVKVNIKVQGFRSSTFNRASDARGTGKFVKSRKISEHILRFTKEHHSTEDRYSNEHGRWRYLREIFVRLREHIPWLTPMYISPPRIEFQTIGPRPLEVTSQNLRKTSEHILWLTPTYKSSEDRVSSNRVSGARSNFANYSEDVGTYSLV